MNRTLPFDPDRRARLWLGVAVFAFATAVAIAYFCEVSLARPALVGGFDRPVATAGEVVRLPTIEVVARRSVVLAQGTADAPACTTC
jgi:hypothetical protein